MSLSNIATLLLCAAVLPLAQAQPDMNSSKAQPKNENGAVQVYADGGWSFGFPANRAAVQVGSVSTISPDKKLLNAPSFGASVTAWKFIVPFFDLTVYDTGKATASVGNVSSQVTANTLSAVGGVRFVGGKSRARVYAEVGGGTLRQKGTTTFSFGSGTQTTALSGSAGALMAGGGFQWFAGRRWGTDLGFDMFHLTQRMTSGGSNYGRVKIGVFFQTKSTVR